MWPSPVYKLLISILFTFIGSLEGSTVTVPWYGETVIDLHKEYHNIFKFGNRNAASHLWSSFLLDRSPQMSKEKLELMFTGYCAISGSPVRPNDYNRYKLNLELAVGNGTRRTGFLHYCCWPCVCDTQDFIKVDTKTVTLRGGLVREFFFAVIGNPCNDPAALREPFVQPFDRRETSIAREAREVRCGPDGELLGATLSDNGFVIIGLFFDLDAADTGAVSLSDKAAQPGRITHVGGVPVQDEAEYADMCIDRARQGYNSGMGEIFRRVAAVSPVPVHANAMRNDALGQSEL